MLPPQVGVKFVGASRYPYEWFKRNVVSMIMRTLLLSFKCSTDILMLPKITSYFLKHEDTFSWDEGGGRIVLNAGSVF